jgi:hypothetical protein
MGKNGGPKRRRGTKNTILQSLSQIFSLALKSVFHWFQHIDVDLSRLTKLLSEAIAKFRLLKKLAQLALMNSLEKAVWNWMDNYRKRQISSRTLCSGWQNVNKRPHDLPKM